MNIKDILLPYIPNITYQFPLIGEVNFQPFLMALAIFIVLNALFWAIRKIVIVRLKAISERTSTTFDDALIDAAQSIKSWVYSIVSIYVALLVFDLSEMVYTIATAIFLVAVVWQVIEIILSFVSYGTQKYVERTATEDGQYDPNTKTITDMIKLAVRIILWGLGGLFILSNLGLEITSLLAGLGIGGIAIAFALQGILSDLFASFSIYFDRPFRVGDFIIIGQDSGTVEKIGIKSTRIRSLRGEELVVSNAELTSVRVQNLKKMAERRIQSTFGITYETDQKLIEEIPQLVTDIFANIDGARLDRIHFSSFGDSALIYEVVYFVEASDYQVYMDLQQEFNVDLFRTFAEKGIEFAYPTQTIYTKSAS